MKKNNFPGFEKGPKGMHGATWKIDREVVYNWLLEKKFISPNDMLE